MAPSRPLEPDSKCNRLPLWIIFFFFCASASVFLISATIHHNVAGFRCLLSTANLSPSYISQESWREVTSTKQEKPELAGVKTTSYLPAAGPRPRRRRRLRSGGPGSSPPRCAAKCGSCRPCRAVHVAVPPGTPVTAEYYPEAWRCKCGNRLFIP